MQLRQVLPFLWLDRFAVQFFELVLGQDHNLVAVLGSSFGHRVVSEVECPQSLQRHQHRAHLVIKVSDQIVRKI